MKRLFFLIWVLVFFRESVQSEPPHPPSPGCGAACVGSYAMNGARAVAEVHGSDVLAFARDDVLVAAWIAGQQYANSQLSSFGGIRVGQGTAYVTASGLRYCRVSPYSANLAVRALLEVKAPQAVPVAERWMEWYFAHLNSQDAPDGIPCDHFYFPDGGGETTCVKPGDPFLCNYNDATDSAAATFFSVLWAAYEAGTPLAELNTPERRLEIKKLADVLMKLQQPDGLFWAKADYRVKYLEDNCEVFAGLGALADLESNVSDDSKASARYRTAADRVQRAIFRELYDSRAQLFRIAKFENGSCPPANLNTWYPDTQAQLWPVIFGVMAPTDSRARALSGAINNYWNGRMHPGWADDPERVNQGWIEAGHAYGALLLGDSNQVRTWVGAVKHYKFQAAHEKLSFAWPFSVDDAGWLVRLMASEP